MKKPSVSIILPTYNHCYSLDACLGNILDQTFTDYEIILVDDGSTDKTKEIAEKFIHLRNAGNTIHYFSQKHSGVSTARNAGIAYARADLISFIDDDDRWGRRKLELQLKVMKADEELALTYTNLYLLYRNSGKKVLQSGKERMLQGYIFKELLYKCFIITSSVMARKDVLNEVGLFDSSLEVGEDWDLWIRIAYKNKIGYIPEPLLFYSMHSNNTHKDTQRMLKGHARIINKVFYSGDFSDCRNLKISAKLNFYLTAAEVHVRNRCLKNALKNLLFALVFMRPRYFWGFRRFLGVCYRFFVKQEFNS